MNIGQKIKAERQRLGLTQDQICRNVITRSSLSQIENGKTVPTVDTLCYLADQLGLPAAYFLSEDATPFFYQKAQVLPRIKDCIRRKEHSQALGIWDDAWGMDAELANLLGECAIESAVDAMKRESAKEAMGYLTLCKNYLEKMDLPSPSLQCRYLTLHALLTLPEEKHLHQTLADARIQGKAATFDEVCRYLSCDSSYSYQTPFFDAHIKAKEKMACDNYKEALYYLEKALSFVTEEAVYPPALRVVRDAEECCERLQEYEKAYYYAKYRRRQEEALAELKRELL